MKAVVFPGDREVAYMEFPDPTPGPGEILVRVLAAGICGTDRHLFKGEFPCAPPVTLGHEFSGEVVAVGQTRLPLWKSVPPAPSFTEVPA